MRFHVLDEPCMLLHEFLLREEGLAINLALYPPLLAGSMERPRLDLHLDARDRDMSERNNPYARRGLH
jgi:hypothetical protein